jgi:hypothetical protein
MVRHSRPATIGYLVAAVPAIFLPVSYLAMAAWVCLKILPALLTGGLAEVAEPSGVFRDALAVGIYGTLIQWPFYLAWAALSFELTFRVRMLWVATIIVANMFAMPWFLVCKYRGTAQTAVTLRLRQGAIRRFLEE